MALVRAEAHGPVDVVPVGDAADDLREALNSAFAGEEAPVGRLSRADTSVRLTVAGNSKGVTLLLDRRPPMVAQGDAPAEIEIALTEDQAHAFGVGQLPLTAAVLDREVTVTGPVRRYLEVDPILRGLLNGGAGDRTARDARPFTEEVPKEPVPSELLAIETRDLHKSFGQNCVLNGVDLRIPEGVVSVVLGPSGTGKSVVLQHIIGSMRPNRGDVFIRGRQLNRMSRSELLALRTEMGVMYQDGALFSAMSVFDNVAFPIRQHTDLRENEVRDVVMTHLESVGLVSAAGRMPNELSGGMRKRAGLARALALDPGIILCDEPDSGLDPVRTALLGELLVEQHAQTGGTMLVITHDILLARTISEHISILWRGKVLEAGLTRHILASGSAFVRQFLAGDPRGPLTMDA